MSTTGTILERARKKTKKGPFTLKLATRARSTPERLDGQYDSRREKIFLTAARDYNFAGVTGA